MPKMQQGGKIEGKLDGRMYHNTPPGVLARLAGEVAYTRKRLCIRTASQEIKFNLELAESYIEKALEQAMKEHGLGVRANRIKDQNDGR